jgi:hypothetical protein
MRYFGTLKVMSLTVTKSPSEPFFYAVHGEYDGASFVPASTERVVMNNEAE